MPRHVQCNLIPYLVCLKVTKFLEECHFPGIRKNTVCGGVMCEVLRFHNGKNITESGALGTKARTV